MLRKIQRRFILAAMAAFGTVMLLIVAGINLANYVQTTSRQDRLAMVLLEGHDRRGGGPPGKGRLFGGRPNGPDGMFGDGREDVPGDVSGGSYREAGMTVGQRMIRGRIPGT